ncbi:SRPBCC family protein [Seonamhaeicola marinus]|uniref:Activator of HSP90 ATPase n=1 Tax=Seonamhaeicola marinus TaxID=1912246 RepID=A0A5D0HTX7_9FLAO|nr:SRPBCC domain-containing protein [Seonamhaeicola marinus]TYA74451.1 activator of HSP90 ATPase [Seonamhaeicola marinus]
MEDLTNRTLTIEKTFEAPLELVWKAWTTSEHIAKWWVPQGAELTVLEHNFEVGGQWKYAMPMPDGSQFISEGTYKEIVEFKKIVTTADFKPMTANVELIAEFEGDVETTKFKFSVIHETPEYCKQQEEMGFYNGWGSAFDRLNTHLESLV